MHSQYKSEKIVVCNEEGHNKFWAASADPATYTVHVRWGRLGTKGMSKDHQHGSAYAAERFIETKFNEKRRKGYSETYQGKKIDHALFERLSTEAAIVGTSNKCSEFQWVELVGNSVKPISEDKLQDPNINPGLMVSLDTKKAYGGRHNFRLLFTFDRSYDLSNGGHTEITKGSPLFEIVGKVEEALGRSLSA